MTVTYLSPHTAGGVGMEKDEQQFKLFKQFYPHITVELSPVGGGWDAVKEKFIVLATAGTPAHLVQNGFGVWMDLARGGTLRELSSYFKTDKLSPDALFLAQATTFYSTRDVLYGFPVSISADQFPYNKDLFDTAGLPYPPTDTSDKSWTMEKFLDVAQKLTKPGEQAGMTNTHSTYYFDRGSWYGQVVWDDSKRQAFVNHPTWMKGAQFWVDLVHKYRVIPTGDESTRLAGGASDPFVAGKAAILYTCCPHGLKDVPFRWGMATLPYSGPAGSPNMAGRIHPHGLHVAKTIPPEHLDAIWTLFRWYMSKPDYGGLMPPANSHIVAPYKDTRYSDIALQQFEELTHGVSGKAPLLTAQHAPQSSGNMSKYEEYNDIVQKVDGPWGKVAANEMPVGEWAELAQKAIEDAKLGSKSAG